MGNAIYFHGSFLEYWKFIASMWERIGGNQKVNLSYNKMFNYLEYDKNKTTLPEAVLFFTGERCLGATLFASPISDEKVISIPFFEELNEIDYKSALATLDILLGCFKEDNRFVFADDLESPVQPQSKPKKRKKKRGPHWSSTIALNHLREIYFKTLQNKSVILTRKDAAQKVGIATNTWRVNDLELWNHWEDDGYVDQNMQ